MGRKHDYHYQQILIASFCHTARLPDWLGGRGDVRQDGCINLLCVELHHCGGGGWGGHLLNNNHQLLYVDV